MYSMISKTVIYSDRLELLKKYGICVRLDII